MATYKVPFLKVPDFDPISDNSGRITSTWQSFFRLLKDILDPLGVERIFDLNNNQVAPLDIPDLKVSKLKTSHAIVEYLIQRVTVGTNPVELLESGTFHLVYRPTQDAWVKVNVGTPGPDDSLIDLSVTPSGQCQYVSELVDGSPSISKIIYRIRTLSGKNKQYSGAG